MLKKVLLAFVAAALIFAFGLSVGFVAKSLLLSRLPGFNTTTVVTRIQTLSQLVTVKYVLEKVVVLEDVKWYPMSENRVVLVAHGVAKAGIDLSRLQPGDIKVSEKKITIRLPKPGITDCYLDDDRTEVLDRTTGVMRAFDKNLEQNARRQAIDDLRHAALQEGILKDAEDRARAQLSNLLFQFGFTEVEFK